MRLMAMAVFVLILQAANATELRVIMAGASSSTGEEVTINMYPRNNISAPFMILTQAQTSSGTGSMTYSLYGGASLSGPWVTLCSSTITFGATAVADPCGVNFPYPYIRGDITAISGTGASATMMLYRDGD